jgi:hypothetical protein
VTLFASAGEITEAEGLVQRVAEALAALDQNPVLVVNAKETGPEIYRTSSSPSDAERYTATSDAASAASPQESPSTHLVTMQGLTNSAPGTLPALINQARNRSGYVFIDASCVSGSAITSLAAAHSDAVVLIVQEGASRRKQIHVAKQQFTDLNVSVVGFIYLRGA